MSLKKKLVFSAVAGALVIGGVAATVAIGNAAEPDVVCQGSTVTLSGEAGAPAASSGTFPVGTKLKVTNLDNGQSTTVAVNGPSGSCVLLNNAAFEKVREPGKNLIRRARIERVGGGGEAAAPAAPAAPAAGGAGASGGAAAQVPPATGEVVCQGSTVTLSGEAGAPAASSGTFPVGTKLKVTNLDNGQATTVTVNGPSGSCVLLNNAAFEKVREPGKNLIRRARIERVGGGGEAAAPGAPAAPAAGGAGASGGAAAQVPPATGEVVCQG
ncbi:hypothetical protein, partial [Streptomyces sp. NPDC089795]|uniref:hypothetical protein n=1 Tax=Streptomyces sp. NPDC089795 TaxID=3155297 RepID=UPI003421C218